MVGRTQSVDGDSVAAGAGGTGAEVGARVYARMAAVLGVPGPQTEDALPPEGLTGLGPGRRGALALLALAVLVAVAAGWWTWRSSPQPEVVTGATAAGTARAQVSVAPSTPGELTVAVSGLVRTPGLVRLPAGARVADAVDAAGGVLPGADIGYLNLARKLTDGELVLVGITPSGPVDGVVPPEGSAGSQTPATVNLNTATLAELETLPGIGPVLAQRILDYRISHGGFRAATDLRKVDGIGTARFEQLKDRVSV